MYIDSYYLILVLPTIILSLWAQYKVKSTFAKYSKIQCSRKITGQDAAALLLKTNRINNVSLEPVRGSLTDHYDPSAKKVRLSEPVYNASTIAAVGVAAHEAGHAIQHATKWGPLALRSTLVPVANIGSRFGPILAMIGLFLGYGYESGGAMGMMLFNIGILLFSGAVLFYVITLPVEFNASNRALVLLRQNNVLTEQELKGVRKVLTAAALTYVASALTAIASLLRMVLIARGRRR